MYADVVVSKYVEGDDVENVARGVVLSESIYNYICRIYTCYLFVNYVLFQLLCCI